MTNKEILGFDSSSALPWLNAISPVELLVQEFTASVLEEFSKQIDRSSYMDWLEARLMGLNDLFLGFERTNDVQLGFQRGTWNTPQRLGSYLQLHAPVAIHDTNFAVRDVCMAHAVHIVSLTHLHADEDVTTWGGELLYLTACLINLLLGLPQGGMQARH